MSDFERQAVGKESRQAVPRRSWTPEEEHRQDLLQRYLAAVAGAAATQSAARDLAPGEATAPGPEREAATPQPPPAPRVREVMSVPAVSVRGDTPFLEVAHTLSREHVSAVPVVDAEDHVIGVVSESDLLAKAAVMSATHRPGPLARLREHRLYEKSRGETAATLMTYPAISVHPGDLVTDAAWTAARSRLKRLPVVDHLSRLVGVVSRIDLLRSLVRDDAEIKEEMQSRILRSGLLLDPAAFQVEVSSGVVTVEGHLDVELIPKLLESIREIEDVVEVVDHLS
ncbi:CBS domain-containing protein [Streptomyces hirsutus]|uniref:CBS domain-containing protein n=1 Tax=Streptomyces hirsutus TaxID=35620 RepID=A0ABZ1GFW4_9ACTN|nr:CBS domain-containing protein [Streptomyces hirsutus]WSD04989.1 CBS domain-containing protein [Streptomyces hirsutus]WTD21616.1 CBS domain-containing protein [Streptomyces hirsutus]